MCASMAEGATEVAEGIPEIPEKPTWWMVQPAER